jgi:hypothetical protein
MSVAEIIAEIDAYLRCLRQARDLLAGCSEVAGPRDASRRQMSIEVTQKSSVCSARVRIPKIKTRQRAAQRKTKSESKAVDLLVAPDSMTAVQATQFQPHATSQQSPPGEKTPFFAGENRAQDAKRQRSGWRKQTTASESAKPANALAGAVPLRVVVVSAEEARKARERAVPSAVRRQSVSGAGLSGRMAFEALFKVGSDPSV